MQRHNSPQRDIAIATFQTKHLTPEIQEWASRAEIAIPMSCSRQIYFGHAKDFEDFPGLTNPSITHHVGEQAYRYMISLTLGLQSKRHREDSIKGQVFQSWDDYQTDDEAKYKQMFRIMQDLKADTRFVGRVLSDYKYHRHEISARDLSGQQKGDTILIVGSQSRHGNMSPVTDGIARVCGNKRSNGVSEIIVTNPKRDVERAVYDELIKLKQRGILAADIKRANFSSFSQTIEHCDRVYIDMPMDSHPQADEHMILSWQTRIKTDNTLTHMRGKPQLQGGSTPLWEEAKLDSYIAPEDIRTDMAARAKHNVAVLEKAERAIDFCAATRIEGKSPSNASVRDHLLGLDEAVPALRIA
jgi:hypothetical protein